MSPQSSAFAAGLSGVPAFAFIAAAFSSLRSLQSLQSKLPLRQRARRAPTIPNASAKKINSPKSTRGFSRCLSSLQTPDQNGSQFRCVRCRVRQFFHIVAVKRKIPNRNIFFHAVLMNRLRNHHNAALNVPPQNNLADRFSVLRRNFRQNRICKNSVLSFRERSPSLRHNAVIFHRFKSLLLLKKRMQLNLVHRRQNLKILAQIAEPVRIHIAHAHRADFSCLVQIHHRTVRAVVIAERLMKKIQIQILKPKSLHRFFKSLFRILVAVILNPKFCRNEQLLSLHKPLRNRARNSPANRLLILISRRRVNQTVARTNRIINRLLRNISIRHLKNPKPQPRHLHTIVQRNKIHKILQKITRAFPRFRSAQPRSLCPGFQPSLPLRPFRIRSTAATRQVRPYQR